MFDLEQAIVEWRGRMTAGGIKDLAVLDELEAHLLEEIQERTVAGESAMEAFKFAVVKVGTAKSLRTEFNKITDPASLPIIVGTSLWVVLVFLLLVQTAGKISGGIVDLLLCGHIVTLTAGYLATFLTGAFALYFVCLQWRGRLVPGEQNALDRAIVRFNFLSVGLIATGFTLGAVWFGQHPGARLTGHSQAREWAAVIVGLWQLITLAIRRFSRSENSLRLLVCICGDAVGALGWFGPVYLDAKSGLHFLTNSWPLQIFLGFHLLVIALALARRFETVRSKESQYV
jgi:hypothetical protein